MTGNRYVLAQPGRPRASELVGSAQTIRGLVFGKRNDGTLVGRRVPEDELWRYDPGRQTNLDIIEAALRMADYGYMRNLCDLASRTLEFDPKLSSLALRRFGQVIACDMNVTPAKGEGVDKAKALRIANIVKQELELLPDGGLWALLADVAWAIYDGRAATELVWEKRPTIPSRPVSTRIVETIWVHPRRLAFGPERELRVVDGHFAGQFAPIGLELRANKHKFVSWKPRVFRDYPERNGLARWCIYWAFFKRVSVRERMILLELFSKPREFVEHIEGASNQGDSAEDTAEKLELMGPRRAMAVPPGLRINSTPPHPESTQAHTDAIAEGNEEMATLWLGTPSTSTDAATRANGQVGERQQDIVLARDGRWLSHVTQEQLVRAIVENNAEELELSNESELEAYLPRACLKTEPERDRTGELGRLQLTNELGAPIGLDTVYEVSGFAKPEKDEPVILGGKVLLKAPEPEDPEVAKAKAEAMAQAIAGSKPGEPPKPGQKPGEEGKPPAPGEKPAADEEGSDEQTADEAAEAGEEEDKKEAAARERAQLLGLVDELREDPIDELAKRGTTEGARITERWARAFTAAASGLQDPAKIRDAIETTGAAISDHELAASIHEHAMRALMVAIFESAQETDSGAEGRPLPTIYAVPREPSLEVDGFIRRPFNEAVERFRKLKLVPKSTFEQLDAERKRQSFTIAGLARGKMLEDAHRALLESLQAGESMKDWRDKLATKFEKNGWTPLAPFHAETVFRVQVARAHAEGAKAHMLQPLVRERRPWWQILTVKDDRRRDNHKDAEGLVVRYDDAFWERAPLPWGFNCRCKVRALSDEEVERRLLRKATDGDQVLAGLPDEGWVNSYDEVPALLAQIRVLVYAATSGTAQPVAAE